MNLSRCMCMLQVQGPHKLHTQGCHWWIRHTPLQSAVQSLKGRADSVSLLRVITCLACTGTALSMQSKLPFCISYQSFKSCFSCLRSGIQLVSLYADLFSGGWSDRLGVTCWDAAISGLHSPSRRCLSLPGIPNTWMRFSAGIGNSCRQSGFKAYNTHLTRLNAFASDTPEGVRTQIVCWLKGFASARPLYPLRVSHFLVTCIPLIVLKV